MARLTLRVAAHPVSAWFLRLLAQPFLVVNGSEQPVRWGHPVTVDVPDGPVRVGAGVRYRARSPLGGYEPERIDPRAWSETVVTLRNGWLNHTPFRVRSR